jgi:CubicO group peptidase (beta-lactamase class C family)
LTYDAKSPDVAVNTMYDIASLTKVVATTTLVAKLAEGDFPVPIDLDAQIERYLPEWASGPQAEWRHRVTIRHLLTHTSGLPPFKEYWRTSKSKQDTLTKIFAEPLDYEPGTKEVYSDLGIILMAEIIERLTGKPLDVLAREFIFAPLAMPNSMYNPPRKLWSTVAPTEIDNQYRHHLIQGEVHDENAAPSAEYQAMRESSAQHPTWPLSARCCSTAVSTRTNASFAVPPSPNLPLLSNSLAVHAHLAGLRPLKAEAAAISSVHTRSATPVSPAHPFGSIPIARFLWFFLQTASTPHAITRNISRFALCCTTRSCSRWDSRPPRRPRPTANLVGDYFLFYI